MWKFPLKAIRRVFPRFPSEREAAAAPANWLLRAQSFCNAATVLMGEQHRHGKPAGPPCSLAAAPDLLRLNLQAPALYCLAFGLELSLKAALVSQGKKPEGHHNLLGLARKLRGLELSKRDEEALEIARHLLKDGKYIVSKEPKADVTPQGLPPFGDLHDLAKPLLDRLWELASTKGPSVAR